MIGNQKTQDEGYVTIATKVPRHVADLLQILAQQRGMEVYELLQLLVNGFISAAKHTGPVTPQVRLLLEALRTDAAYNRAFNFASPTAVSEIAQMVLIIQQPGRKEFGLLMIDRPFMDNAQMTYCVDDILERVAEVSMKGLYRELRQVGVAVGSNSLRETLIVMCDAQLIARLDEDFHSELPQMGDRTDYGRPYQYGAKTKSHHHRTPDGEAQRQLRLFDPDRPYGEQADEYLSNLEERARQEEADYLEGELGFRPFDQEF